MAPYSRYRRSASSARSAGRGLRRAGKSVSKSTRARSTQRLARRVNTVARSVSRVTSMIETKEGCFKTTPNAAYQHNTIGPIGFMGSGSNDLFYRQTATNTDDPMTAGALHVIGDSMVVRGVKATFFLENSLGRPKVYYRIMLVKGPRGATFTNDIFKGITGNIMIDQINTERYTVIASKRLTVTPSNAQATNATLTGLPQDNGTAVGSASRIVNFWIPGKKFGKQGRVQYENGSALVKFFDYHWVIAVYDWYGTPILNNVGQINEGYYKIYFKDA